MVMNFCSVIALFTNVFTCFTMNYCVTSNSYVAVLRITVGSSVVIHMHVCSRNVTPCEYTCELVTITVTPLITHDVKQVCN
jgi:hypothetical protein